VVAEQSNQGLHKSVVEFLREEVLERFELVINADGSHQHPPSIDMPSGASVTTDEGDSCQSLDDLIAYCYEEGRFPFPAKYKCRIGIQSRAKMRMLRRSNGKFGLFCEGKVP
jgi:hypothetical protein